MDGNNISNLFEELIKKQRKNCKESKKLTLQDIRRITKNLRTSIFDVSCCSLWEGYITNKNKEIDQLEDINKKVLNNKKIDKQIKELNDEKEEIEEEEDEEYEEYMEKYENWLLFKDKERKIDSKRKEKDEGRI